MFEFTEDLRVPAARVAQIRRLYSVDSEAPCSGIVQDKPTSQKIERMRPSTDSRIFLRLDASASFLLRVLLLPERHDSLSNRLSHAANRAVRTVRDKCP
eukprot:scaffold29044_cov18-Prasinocladus_malaysianus.AAC.1